MEVILAPKILQANPRDSSAKPKASIPKTNCQPDRFSASAYPQPHLGNHVQVFLDLVAPGGKVVAHHQAVYGHR